MPIGFQMIFATLPPSFLEGLHHAQRHLVAPGVILADEGDVARAELLVEIVAERMADLARRHRGAHHGRRAVPLGHVVGAGGIHHQRNAGLLADLRHRRAFVPAQRADHDMHLLLVHQAARLGDRLVGIAGRIRDHVLDLAAAGHVADLLPEQLEAVDHVDARRRERAGERHQQADLDRSSLLRKCRRRAERGGEQRGAGRADEISTQSCGDHESSPTASFLAACMRCGRCAAGLDLMLARVQGLPNRSGQMPNGRSADLQGRTCIC